MTNRPPTPIADSPWFWFILFVGVGLTFLLVTDGKFNRRQAGIERKYQVDEWIRAQKAQGEWKEEEVATELISDRSGQKLTVPIPKYSTPGNTRIQIGPLKAALGFLWFGCVGMFVRERLLQRNLSDETEPSGRSTS